MVIAPILKPITKRGKHSNQNLGLKYIFSLGTYKIHWNYTLDKWNKDELKGYWIWAMPTAKKMKTNNPS